MKQRLVSLWNWFEIVTLIVVWTVVISILFAVTWPFDKVRYHVGRWFRRGGVLLVKLNPLWHVQVRGHRLPARPGPFVVVSNHQSVADIPVLSHLPWEMKWLSKASNFKLPGFGWMMRMAGDIPLHRGDRESAAAAMARCRWYLERGMPVMIFPEGTRSPEDRIREFKDGAFRLALEAGCPILPVVVVGTRDCLPKNSWKFGESKVQIRVQVLEPVSVEGLSPEDVDRLRDQVRAEMIDAYERIGTSLRKRPEARARPGVQAELFT